jgi:hypothetical protein
VVIDEKLSVAFKENQTLKPQQRVGVKGRFVGYDDLLKSSRWTKPVSLTNLRRFLSISVAMQTQLI